jgi:hypothetical protein
MMLASLTALVLAAAPVRVLVLDLEPSGVTPDVAKSIDALVLQGATVDGVEVLAERDIRQLAELEAQKAEMGCDTSSCLAELAGALGAELVLFGSVGKLGGTTTVSLSLFDSKTTQIRRDSVNVEKLGALPREVPPRVRALVEAGLGRAEVRSGPNLLFWGGVGAIGLGGVGLVVGSTVIVLSELTIDDPSELGTRKADAQRNGLIGIGVFAVGTLVAVGGVVLVALAGE